ncbi:MAG: hypothetical protein AVDCRST_MAG19-1396 [uncultured Thermomicrobiales bacterium]|uniref:Uncharacterized protein n=1 Tax=uncultured Thermomicrobiales bacterium TaxID=1645740 RepID=A0A6J4UU24_9BACT|nr:MAG: hypothetical protein AVDCRST_MAG19-1396 [uncultured Thermomicrobiales bacterium]
MDRVVVAGICGSLGIAGVAVRHLSAQGRGRFRGRGPGAAEGSDAEFPTDVTSAANMRHPMALAVVRHRAVDVQATSAGVQRYGTAVETGEAAWKQVIAIDPKDLSPPRPGGDT